MGIRVTDVDRKLTEDRNVVTERVRTRVVQDE